MNFPCACEYDSTDESIATNFHTKLGEGLN